MSTVKSHFKHLVAVFAAFSIIVTIFGSHYVEAAGGLNVYVVPAITDSRIIPSTNISSVYLSNTIQVTASPGEFEPASFVVKATNDIQSLQVSATSLVGATGSIPAANVDISVIKDWYQGGYDTSIGCYGRYLIPELLLKNDALVTTNDTIYDNSNGNNYLLVSGNYMLISARGDTYTGPTVIPNSQRPISDSATLQPVNIAGGSNKQFWLTVNVPKTASAGSYQGSITLSSGGTTMGQIQLNVQVLPVNLSASSLTYSIFYRGLLRDTGSISSEDKSTQQMTADLVDMLNHGVTNPEIFSQGSLATLKSLLSIRQQLGMSNQPVFTSSESYGMSLSSLVALYKSYGATDVYFFGIDEGTDAQNRPLINSFHAAGAKAYVAVSPAVANSLVDILDVAVVSGVPSSTLAAKYHQYGHKIFTYANPPPVPELPATFRLNYGLLLWQNNYDGAMTYDYQHAYNDIWNDFDYWGGDRDHVFAYPTMNGEIDTVQWEGFREGVDDMRYMTTLVNTINAARSAGKDTSAADSWLASLKTSDLTTMDLNLVRLQMVTFIRNLSSNTLAPVLSSIGNKSVLAGSTLQFSVAATSPDGSPLTYSAYNLPPGASFNAQTHTFSWTPITDNIGKYGNVHFEVSNGTPVAWENITITVTGPNRAPVLNPIGNKSVVAGSLLKFTISAYDPDGDALTYSAVNLPWPGASLQGTTFYWTPTTSQVGTYTNVQFSVSDGKLTTSENITLTVTAVGANRPPVLNPIGNKSVVAGSLLQFSISGSDPDGNALTYSASNLPTGAAFNASTMTFSWTPTMGQVGTYTNVHFQVSDSSLTDYQNITITVTGTAVNQPPVLNPIGNKSVVAGSLLQFTISGSDPDGNALTYSASNLPGGAAFNSSTMTFSWTPTTGQVGTYPGVYFQVSDGSLTDSESIAVTVTGNRPPVLNAIGSKSVVAGSLLKFTISGSDPDGDALTYSADNLPSGASLQGTTFYWTPTTSQVGTYTNVYFQISDGKLIASESITITVTGTAVNQPPVLNPIGNKSVVAGSLLQFTISGSDPDGNALTYSASNLPGGAAFNSSTMTFSWTPTTGQVGTYPGVYFQVSDGSLTDSESIAVTVTGNRPPVLNAIGSKSVVAGSQLKFTISGSDPDGDALTYSASNLPSGASLQGTTFYWTPTTSQVGTYTNVYFQISDGKLIASESITITVTGTAVNQPPVLNPIGNKSVVAGSQLKFSISGSDPDGDTLTYSANNLPAGASLQGTTFYWTPTTSQVGTYVNIYFAVSDGKVTVYEIITIFVTSS